MFGLGYITGAVSKVATGVTWAGKKVFEKAAEYFEKPWEIVKGVRDSIFNVVKGTVNTVGDAITPGIKTGANIDAKSSEVITRTNEVLGANKVDIAEGRLIATERAEWSGKAIEFSEKLDRIKSEDGKTIAKEASIEKDWATSGITESGPEAQPTTPGDEKFSKQIVSFINNFRSRSGSAQGSEPLKIDKQLSVEAKKRAAVVTHRGDSHLIPYRYLRIPPITRKNDIVKEGSGVTMSGKYPRFPADLTREERSRVADINFDTNTGTYKAILNESDHDFAERIRKAQSERDAFQVVNLNFTFDLNEESYPLDSNPRELLERICKDDVTKKNLLLDMKKIGVGIHREGTKVAMSFFMTNESPSEENLEAPLIEHPDEYRCNEWWMNQIEPDKKARKSSPSDYSIQELYDRNESEGKPAFRSGYSLYEYSQFRDAIDALKARGKNVEILPVQFYPNDTINEKAYHTLHIPLKINGQGPTELILIMGTDIVAMTKVIGQNEAQGGQKDFCPLSEYLKKLTPKLDDRQLVFPGGNTAKRQQPPHRASEGEEDQGDQLPVIGS